MTVFVIALTPVTRVLNSTAHSRHDVGQHEIDERDVRPLN